MKTSEDNKAVFLDRDGTLNEEMGYINHPSRFQIFDFAAKAVKQLNDAGFHVFIVTNQAGIARGYFTESLLDEIHEQLENHMNQAGAIIEKIYYCPHHPRAVIKKYKTDCACRKPNPGMIHLAEREFKINRNASYMVGDRYQDVVMGKRAGLKTIMLLTGYGRGEYMYQRDRWETPPDMVEENVLTAAEAITLGKI